MAAQISGTGAVGLINSMTAQNSTSGTALTFTGIPTGVKRITVMFNQVSTNGTSLVQIQIGSGSLTTSGYLSSASTNGGNATSTTGFLISQNNGAVDARSGAMTILNITGNTWVASGCASIASNSSTSSGVVTISGTLDRIALTTVNGTDTFDLGSVNVLYE